MKLEELLLKNGKSMVIGFLAYKIRLLEATSGTKIVKRFIGKSLTLKCTFIDCIAQKL